jgi:glycosyltransferase involved in cell wall biosynthesis
MNLSITIIGHNEVEHLRKLLPQLKWADEIVYVDCESHDGSLEVARETGCRVYSRLNFKLKRRNHYFGKWLRHGSQYPDTQLRLFRKDSAHFPNQHVHEKLVVEGRVGKLENDMLHFPYLNISQFLSKFDFYTGVEAGYLRDSGVQITTINSLRFFLLKPFSRFLRRYFLKGGFRDGLPGLFCAIFDALNFVVRYFKLWELTQNPVSNSKF